MTLSRGSYSESTKRNY